MLGKLFRIAGRVAGKAAKGGADIARKGKLLDASALFGQAAPKGKVINAATRFGGSGGGGAARGLGKWFGEKGGRGGLYALNALKGAAWGSIPGAAMWAGTGDFSWMPIMMGAGALRGGAKGFMKDAAPMKTPNFRRKAMGYMAGRGMMTNLAIGTTIGAATESPEWAVYGAAGIPVAKGLAKFLFHPKGSMTMLKGMLQAPFSPNKAAATLSRLTTQQASASAGFMGLLAGGAYGAYGIADRAASGYERRDNSVTAGYFPGGVMPLGQGGPGIGNNHLSSEGLTLALHRNANKTRVV